MGQLSARGEASPSAAFAALADLVYADAEYDGIYRAICESALTIVDGCDHASMMLREGDRLRTAAATDSIAIGIDAAERALGNGPCADAIDDPTPCVDADISRASTWPELARHVRQHTPVRGMAGFRVLVGGRKAAALNLFADRPNALTDLSIDLASMLAAFASVALLAAARNEQANTLRSGLANSREIGTAVGLMMAFHHVDSDAAFTILRRASQEANVKLAKVAHEVVQYHDTDRTS